MVEPDQPERKQMAARRWAEGIKLTAAVLTAIASVIRALRG